MQSRSSGSCIEERQLSSRRAEMLTNEYDISDLASMACRTPLEKVMKSVCSEEAGTLGGHSYEKWGVGGADTLGNTERRIKERCVFEVCLHLFTLSLHSVLFSQSRRCCIYNQSTMNGCSFLFW